MKNKELKIRISERRLNKVRLYAVRTDKSMTQVIEELIDSLPTLEIGNSSSLREASPTTNIVQ
ncbi:hypothetical protein NIES4072_38260 [Nostoc commune NIES-4072]|uniref:CopG domain protein DNA-binding domain protein n=1 Tax=Nostoc commune NIES-4072 TaxID=2005467 RepID=A0A2R5FLJ8_NOSCO|nr:hypothetical protein [Nostoc commune]BBD68847.1 hypothetical protein NIES4070_52500 [Nostoc commune HK-02]GBG19652.1 hypothetical protein NIES4072_33210 [Nostoc commune NIES-4072]GBG20152.1 hypothetical protein NIES4072_38260 [Nostoc commune NIES-4072]